MLSLVIFCVLVAVASTKEDTPVFYDIECVLSSSDGYGQFDGKINLAVKAKSEKEIQLQGTFGYDRNGSPIWVKVQNAAITGPINKIKSVKGTWSSSSRTSPARIGKCIFTDLTTKTQGAFCYFDSSVAPGVSMKMKSCPAANSWAVGRK